MKKKTVILLSLFLATVIIVGTVLFLNYDSISTAEGNAGNARVAVKQKLTYRAELIENLAGIAKSHGEVEASTLNTADEACAAAKSAKTVSELEAAESGLNVAESELKLVLRTLAPDLVNNDASFAALVNDLYETAKSVVTARKAYNEAARAYNEKLSSNFFSNLFKFKEAPLFSSEEDTLETPIVDF